MKEKGDYIQDLSEIRSMMERSSKFLSLSGWAGIMAGIFALGGVWVVTTAFQFNPNEIEYTSPYLSHVVLLAVAILILSLASAIYFSWRKASNSGQRVWNSTSRRLLVHMAIPLVVGGLLILILISKGLTGFMAPLSLLFYGLALYNAGFYTIREVRYMGVLQMILGLLNVWFIQFGLIFWAIGFGIVHIVYGIYMHYRYER